MNSKATMLDSFEIVSNSQNKYNGRAEIKRGLSFTRRLIFDTDQVLLVL